MTNEMNFNYSYRPMSQLLSYLRPKPLSVNISGRSTDVYAVMLQISDRVEDLEKTQNKPRFTPYSCQNHNSRKKTQFEFEFIFSSSPHLASRPEVPRDFLKMNFSIANTLRLSCEGNLKAPSRTLRCLVNLCRELEKVDFLSKKNQHSCVVQNDSNLQLLLKFLSDLFLKMKQKLEEEYTTGELVVYEEDSTTSLSCSGPGLDLQLHCDMESSAHLVESLSPEMFNSHEGGVKVHVKSSIGRLRLTLDLTLAPEDAEGHGAAVLQVIGLLVDCCKAISMM